MRVNFGFRILKFVFCRIRKDAVVLKCAAVNCLFAVALCRKCLLFQGPFKGKTVSNVSYDDVCKLHV